MAAECLQVLLSLDSLKQVEFIGNVLSKKWNREWASKFADAGKDLKWREDEDDEDEDDEEEDDHEENDAHEEALSELCAKLD